MTRPIALLSCGCVVAIAVTGYGMLDAGDAATVAVPTTVPPAAPASDLAKAIDDGRRTCRVESMDLVVDALRERTVQRPEDRESWHMLANAALARLQTRSVRRGVAVGRPIHDTLPAAVAADIDLGLAAVERARALGDDSSALHRIEAGLLGQRITGLASALQWNGRIQAALAAATAATPDDPELHLSLGLRKLLAPKLFGHDPARALEHLEFAAAALPHDERPALFAAMACHLQQQRGQAIAWLERAALRNPQNPFVAAVLQRVQRGEEDPFGRDVPEQSTTQSR